MAKPKIIRFEKGKEYKRVQNFLSVFKNQYVEIATDTLEDLAKAFASKVKTIIRRQAYRWKPLSKRYLARKISKGLDSRILMATKKYVQSIRAVPRVREKKIVSWGVGPGHPNEKHKPSGLKLHFLARLLEYGTKRKGEPFMPARPHWRPAWSAFVRNKKLMARKIIKQIKRREK